jgi:dihydrofolate reductase
MINVIVAISKNRVIGKNNSIPWYISEDLKRFKKLTLNHPIIMGGRTFESIGRPLRERTNIVVTSKDIEVTQNLKVADTLNSAIEIAKASEGSDEIFFIGGARIFEESLEYIDRLYLTYIDTDIDGDIFFPEIDLSAWRLVSEEKHETEIFGKKVDYYFREYIKKTNSLL